MSSCPLAEPRIGWSKLQLLEPSTTHRDQEAELGGPEEAVEGFSNRNGVILCDDDDDEDEEDDENDDIWDEFDATAELFVSSEGHHLMQVCCSTCVTLNSKD